MSVTPRFESDLLGGLTVLRAEALTEVSTRQYVENVVSKSARWRIPAAGTESCTALGSPPVTATGVWHRSTGPDPVLCLGQSRRGVHASLDPTRTLSPTGMRRNTAAKCRHPDSALILRYGFCPHGWLRYEDGVTPVADRNARVKALWS